MLYKLQCIAKKSTLGVFAADLMPFNLKFPCGFIVNTDNHTKIGTHWCAFYFPNETTVEYFDSYGMPISYFNDYFSKYIFNFSNVTTNSKQLQSMYSKLCGMYSLFFLLNRMNHVSFHDIVNKFSNDYEKK